MKGFLKMKRILSVLILASVLLCSFAACGLDSNDTDVDNTIDTEAEAWLAAQEQYTNNNIAVCLSFSKYSDAIYSFKLIELHNVDEIDGEGSEHGQQFYSVCVKGSMEGQDSNGRFLTKEFGYLLYVYPDGYIDVKYFDGY